MSIDTAQKDLVLALKVANWRSAGAAKFVQTTEGTDLNEEFLQEMKQSCEDAATRVDGAFQALLTEVRTALRQARVADFLPLKKVYEGHLDRRVDADTGEIREDS